MTFGQDRRPVESAQTKIRHRQSFIFAYILALLLPAATLLLRLALSISFGEGLTLILFMFPITVCALMGGLGPGLLATVLAAAYSNYFLIPPTHNFRIAAGQAVVQWGMLIINGILVSAMSGFLHRSLRRKTTRRLQLEESQRQVQQGETRFEAIFEQAAVGIAQVSPESRWLKVNQKLCDIAGYTQGELLSLTFQDITERKILEKDRQIKVGLLQLTNSSLNLPELMREVATLLETGLVLKPSASG